MTGKRIKGQALRAVRLAAVSSLVWLAGCSTTGGPLGLSPAQEKAIGEQQHPLIVREYGGELDDPEAKAFVERVARRLIAASDQPNAQVVVTTLDSPVVNAFALPGHVYVTRGLLALANSEAELAGVVGHEIGHVYARHTAERVSRNNLTMIGSVLVGILTGSQQTAQLAGQIGQLYLLRYSRNQEYEADRIGVKLIAAAGYDPVAEADFLNTLGRWSDLESRVAGQNARPPEFLSTHPNSAERVKRAIAEAQVVAAQGAAKERNQAGYFAMLDGLVYGDDPVRQGFVQGNEFIHPTMGFAFSVPSGYKLANSSNAVIARSQGGGQMQFVGARSAQGPAALIGEVSKSLKVDLGTPRTGRISNREAAFGTARANTQSGPVDVAAYAIRWAGEEHFVFMWLTPASQSSALQGPIESSVSSLRSVSAGSVSVPPTLKLDIVTAKSGDSAASLGNLSKFDTAKQERFIVMNGLENSGAVPAGRQVKIVR